MIVHDELYILLDGSRRKIEIPNPSGISLKFQSNMFNDLSKFCASYSYTFKIPKTANNIEAFDLVDDIRHHSSAYGKKIECEFYRDGIKLFDNSFLYVNECGKSYSAVMTWNVLSWLLEVNESGRSIKDIEKDFAGSQMTTVDFNSNQYNITHAQSMGDPYIDSYYRCGTPFYSGSNPKAVPVRYLLDRISRFFGKGDATDLFSFIRTNPLTNEDFKVSDHSFNIADDGAIPMVSGNWSNNYLQTQIRTCSKLASTKYNQEFPMIDVLGNDMDSQSKSDGILFMQKGNKQFLFFSDVSGSSEYVRFYRHTGSATKGADVFVKDDDGNNTDVLDLRKITWTKDDTANGMYMGFSSVNRQLPIILRGRIRVTDYGRLALIPFVRSNTTGVYTPILDDDGVMQNVIEIDSTEVEGTSQMYEFNFDPVQGGTEIEIEYVENVVFWVAQLQIYQETFVIDGYLNFIPKRETVTFGYPNPPSLNVVDMFSNLPDIKIIDLLKSIFYIENAYPFIEKDGRIGQMRYDDLYKNIKEGNIYDWSDLLVGSQKNDSVKYTNGNLGRINRFNMKNYSSASNSEEDSSLRYDVASSFFQTDNETLAAENTIFTFPFASAAKVTKNGFSAGDTFIFWEYDQDEHTYKVAESVDPIIGRIRSYNEVRYWDALGFSPSVNKALKFDIWQVANKEYDNSILAQIFKKPYVIETKVNLDTFTLSTMDFTRPVYLSRYNAYFGIISVQCDSKGMSKAELIKLPMTDQFEMRSKEDPEIKISGPLVVYKKSGLTAIAKYNIEASVIGSRINRMVVYLDGSKIIDEDIESLSYSARFDYGTHIMSVMVTSVDGRSKTELYETRVDYAAEKASIDFIQYSNYLNISKTKRNVATYKVALYNTTITGVLSVYKYKRGTSNKVLLGSTTEKTLEVEWEYFDQLETDGVRDVNWVLSAEFNGNGESAITTKDVLVSVDRNMLKHYDGIASDMYFQIAHGDITKVGSYIEEAFKYGDFSASYMVIGAKVEPYFVQIKFLCYTDSGSEFLYIYPIDPYDGYSKYITLAKSQFGSYNRIMVTAEAWYYDQAGTYFESGDIWLYRDKQN